MKRRIRISISGWVGILAMILGSVHSVKSQDTLVSDIQFRQDFLVGNTYALEVLRQHEDSHKPFVEDMWSSTQIELKIESLQDTLKACTWRYGETKFVGSNSAMLNGMAQSQKDAYYGMEIKFLIDKHGSLREITNFDECRRNLRDAMEALANKRSSSSAAEKVQVLEFMASTYDTPELMISTYFPEIIAFFEIFGNTIHVDLAYESESDIPNPFGGSPMPSTITTKIESISSDEAIVSSLCMIPDAALRAIQINTFQKMAEQTGKPFDEKEVPDFKMSTFTRYYFNLEQEKLTKVAFEKYIYGSGRSKVERLTVIQK